MGWFFFGFEVKVEAEVQFYSFFQQNLHVLILILASEEKERKITPILSPFADSVVLMEKALLRSTKKVWGMHKPINCPLLLSLIGCGFPNFLPPPPVFSGYARGS